MNIQGYPVIDDTFASGVTLGTGYEGRDLASYPLNGLYCARQFSLPRLDIATIKELIREKTAKKTWVRDHCDRVGLKVKNQQSSNYCWNHGLIRCMEAVRVMAGGNADPLSAFYGAAQIKGGRNQGGSGIVAAEWAAKHGAPLEKYWLPMRFTGAVSAECAANAMQHQITLMEEIEPDDKELIWSSIVQDEAITVGIPAWGHEVCITFLVLDGDKIVDGIDNSWGTSFGNNGRGLLTGRYANFDEAMRVVAVEPSAT